MPVRAPLQNLKIHPLASVKRVSCLPPFQFSCGSEGVKCMEELNPSVIVRLCSLLLSLLSCSSTPAACLCTFASFPLHIYNTLCLWKSKTPCNARTVQLVNHAITMALQFALSAITHFVRLLYIAIRCFMVVASIRHLNTKSIESGFHCPIHLTLLPFFPFYILKNKPISITSTIDLNLPHTWLHFYKVLEIYF